MKASEAYDLTQKAINTKPDGMDDIYEEIKLTAQDRDFQLTLKSLNKAQISWLERDGYTVDSKAVERGGQFGNYQEHEYVIKWEDPKKVVI